MRQNYLNLAIAKRCEKNKRNACYPLNIVHDCVQCKADAITNKNIP